MECPNCNRLMWHQIDDDGVDEWYCHTCGETFIDDGRDVPEDFDLEAEIRYWHEVDRPITPRQRIQAAVSTVVEAASRIRVLLGGKDELPF